MKYKILIVDDDRELLKMLNQYFTLKNYTVMIAENGIKAMEKISANPDIILLDVNMPGMDGFEVVQTLGLKYAEESETGFPARLSF